MRFKVSVVQETGVSGDSIASAQLGCELIGEAAAQGSRLALFPEAFIGGYPKGADFGTRLGVRTEQGRDAFRDYFQGAIEIPGPEIEMLANAARQSKISVVLGVVERVRTTLYCTATCISEEGELLGIHRKVMPTALERLIWGFGDGSTLKAWKTPVGTVGAAICWENYMPLLRTCLYSQGVQVYCAPTVDDRETWIPTMRHIAMEGRCFVLAACQYAPPSEAFPGIRGGSCIVDPFGQLMAGPVYGRPELLTVEIDLDEITRGKFDLDTTGHYARPDLFQLNVNTSHQTPVAIKDNQPQDP